MCKTGELFELKMYLGLKRELQQDSFAGNLTLLPYLFFYTSYENKNPNKVWRASG